MNCWNCENALDEALLCGRCGMPQPIEMLSPFKSLGLAPRLSWDPAELRRSYERLARKCHPDLFRAHRDQRVLTAARIAMCSLNDAFRALSSEVGRLRYALAACGRSGELTRTVPESLQESAQIISRVLGQAEDAQGAEDREAWEALQDHLASLQVQVEKAEQQSEAALRALFEEWDTAVGRAGEDWPEMPPDWLDQALRWLGEREYLESLLQRMKRNRTWRPAVTAP